MCSVDLCSQMYTFGAENVVISSVMNTYSMCPHIDGILNVYLITCKVPYKPFKLILNKMKYLSFFMWKIWDKWSWTSPNELGHITLENKCMTVSTDVWYIS